MAIDKLDREVVASKDRNATVIVEPKMPTTSIYFLSSDARLLFGLKEGDANVIKNIEERVKVPYNANLTQPSRLDVGKGRCT